MLITTKQIKSNYIIPRTESTALYQNSINWDSRTHQQTYTDVMARSDFGSVTGWQNSRAMISNGGLRITIEKNALSGAGGLISNTGIPGGTAYELDFDVKFHSQFDWSRGGKVGFGFGVGNGNTGCNLPTDGAGGSLRLMWYNNGNRVYFHPYIYHFGMPGPCGSNFGKSYPSTGSLQKGPWYKVHMYIKSNTGSNTNGHVQIKINGETLIDQSIRWTTNDKSTALYQKSINWNNRVHQRTYTDVMARSDFGSVTGWQNSRAMISNGALRITLKKNALSVAGGLVSNTNLPEGSAYELQFDVKFHSHFDWSRGGKVGFGLGIGNRNTGCSLPTDGAGGTLRLMWYNTRNQVYFRPYIYHYGMSGPCGTTFNKSYPSTGTLKKGKWYNVYMYAKSNTGNNPNGHVKVLINSTTLIDQNILWTTNDSKRLINNLSFATFRGGKEDWWKSDTNGYIYYDNLSVRQIINSQLSCDDVSCIDRVGWGAQKSTAITNLTSQSLSFYVIHHSASPPCYDDVSCVKQVKGIQHYHQIDRRWADIGYNFLVGENGKVYEGRGWNREAAHSLGWNNGSYGICIIGDFTTASPNEKALNAIRSLMDCGMKSGHVKENYYIITHRQSQRLGYTDCPGNGMLDVVSKWPRYCSFQNSGASLETNQAPISLALDFCEKDLSSTASSSLEMKYFVMSSSKNPENEIQFSGSS
ncbi:unnamed protein product [Rotaria socialis]|uniref:Uncharacterized protein n=1 Tax=Rotaria socialis TaxID=392032 RepID=A0A820BT85_9BILA|nr:unnamed protein product [Rotaria socialis]